MQLQSLRREHGVVAGARSRGRSEHRARARRAPPPTAGRARWPAPSVQFADVDGRASRLGNLERTRELADQERRVIDLSRGQDERQLELQRRRALELEAGARCNAPRCGRDSRRSTAMRSPASARPALRARARRRSRSRRARRHRTTGRSRRRRAARRWRTAGTAANAGGEGQPRDTWNETCIALLRRRAARRAVREPPVSSQAADCGVSKSVPVGTGRGAGLQSPGLARRTTFLDITSMAPESRPRRTKTSGCSPMAR